MPLILCFYSRLVRLKVCNLILTGIPLRCFYSRLVRLKGVDLAQPGVVDVFSFLFQTGSIKSALFPLERFITLICFYSRLVRLKELEDVEALENLPSFYSRLVRLKVMNLVVEEDGVGKFLFQTGSIKSRMLKNTRKSPLKSCFYSRLVRLKVNFLWVSFNRLASFYSRLVRLKAKIPVFPTNGRTAVSIPDWFD